MERSMLENIVDTLIEHINEITQEKYFFFWRYLESCCNSEYEELYILDDLALLAEVLKEKDAHFLIDPIMLYDRLSGQHLERLLTFT
jgi:hypothetical protein